MDKKDYESLKKIDIRNIMKESVDRLRKTNLNYRFVDIISFLYIALMMKEYKDLGKISKEIDRLINNETSRNYLKKTIEDIPAIGFKEVAEAYREEELKAGLLLSEPETFSEINMISTPEGVADLAIRLLEIEEEDTILDLGSGINSFLIQNYIKRSNKKLNGVELNIESLIVGQIRSQVLGVNINVIQGNMIGEDFTGLGANKIFTNPPLGMHWRDVKDYLMQNPKLMKYFKDTKRTISGDWIYALSAYLNQKEEGKTLAIMTNAGTWNKPDELIRETLLEKGLIEGVISLPANIFTFTSMDLVMMVFSQGNKGVRMVDASKIYTEGRRVNSLEEKDIERILEAYKSPSDISDLVDLEEIRGQEYILNPKRYVGERVEIENSIKLGDLVKSINRGSMISSKDLDSLVSSEKTNYQYLMLQDIRDGEISKDLAYLKDLDESYDRYCIRNNNIIISKISPYKVALAKIEEDMKVIANGNLYFLELDEEKVNPIFLTNFLQSEQGIRQLNMYAKGAVMKSISIRDLKEIEIPNLPIEEQNKISEEIRDLDEELIILEKQIDIIRDKKVKLIQEVI